MRVLSFAAVLRFAAVLATLTLASSAHAHAGHHVAAHSAAHASRHVAANAPSSASHRHALSRAPACPGETSGTCSCGLALGASPQPIPACVIARECVQLPPAIELVASRGWPDVRHDTSLLVAATYASRAPPLLLP